LFSFHLYEKANTKKQLQQKKDPASRPQDGLRRTREGSGRALAPPGLGLRPGKRRFGCCRCARARRTARSARRPVRADDAAAAHAEAGSGTALKGFTGLLERESNPRPIGGYQLLYPSELSIDAG
jgi:hypothetical protein